mmetsp:Transcript_138000/g.358473  ORF Transcript_138000/g.358473 Transcript_138000/m.358473 type:complete len:230 (-) Transcript_138000:1-690(-)
MPRRRISPHGKPMPLLLSVCLAAPLLLAPLPAAVEMYAQEVPSSNSMACGADIAEEACPGDFEHRFVLLQLGHVVEPGAAPAPQPADGEGGAAEEAEGGVEAVGGAGPSWSHDENLPANEAADIAEIKPAGSLLFKRKTVHKALLGMLTDATNASIAVWAGLFAAVALACGCWLCVAQAAHNGRVDIPDCAAAGKKLQKSACSPVAKKPEDASAGDASAGASSSKPPGH